MRRSGSVVSAGGAWPPRSGIVAALDVDMDDVTGWRSRVACVQALAQFEACLGAIAAHYATPRSVKSTWLAS